MRGKGNDEYTDGGSHRITPAYAGKSSWHSARTSEPEDHPCVCGEKRKSPRPISNPAGSPLRMRGKGILYKRKNFIHRITPTYAGKRLTE